MGILSTVQPDPNLLDESNSLLSKGYHWYGTKNIPNLWLDKVQN